MKWRAAVALALCLGLVGGGVWAQSSGGFTFKKVRAHGGYGKRITVQIAPEDDYYLNAGKPKELQDLSDAETTAHAPEGEFAEWFWSHSDPSLSAASSKNLDTALATLQTDPAQAARLAPSRAHMRNLVDRYGTDILLATLDKEVSPALVLSVIAVESSGREEAVSPAGAVGLMQLIPETAARFDVQDSTHPADNIRGGAAYLEWLLAEFNRDPLLALAGYNAGENAVRDHNGVPPYKETRNYVPKVVAAWQVAAGFCMTPPKRATDGCVFQKKAP